MNTAPAFPYESSRIEGPSVARGKREKVAESVVPESRIVERSSKTLPSAKALPSTKALSSAGVSSAAAVSSAATSRRRIDEESSRSERSEETELSPDELTAYLAQLHRDRAGLTILIKDGPAVPPRAVSSLPELHRMLLEKQIWGAQVLRTVGDFRHVDTLMVRQGGTLRISSVFPN